MAYRIIIGFLLGIAFVYLFLTSQIALDPWSESDGFNSRTLPYVYGIALAVCAVAMLLRSPPVVARPHNLATLAYLVVGVVILLLLLPLIGLWFALFFFLGGAVMVLGERRWWAVAAIAVSVPLVGWVLVELLLGIVIPL